MPYVKKYAPRDVMATSFPDQATHGERVRESTLHRVVLRMRQEAREERGMHR